MMLKSKQKILKPYINRFNKENTLPNVILITLDAFNYELFEKNIKSLPNMKELKSKSIFFENCFSIGPSTFFSFPGIIGGIYPYPFGIEIDKSIETIDSVLKDHGYSTALINESNAILTPLFGYGKNIDYQKHFLNLSHAGVDRNLKNLFLKEHVGKTGKHHLNYDYMLKKIYEKLDKSWIKYYGKYFFNVYRFLRLRLKNNTENFQERKKLYCEFQKEILCFINERFKRPQFLWIHTIINHLPYFPVENTQKFDINEIDYLNHRGLSGLVNHNICEKLILVYIESLKRTDELIGNIIDTLKVNDLLDDSIIVITADHGEEFMEEEYFGHNPESSSDRLLHVPLMFYYPKIVEHKHISAPVSTIDIPPTLFDLLNLKIPDSNRGVSLKEILLSTSEDSGKYQKFWRGPIFSEAWITKGLFDRNPGYKSNKKIFTVRMEQYRLKVIQERKNDNTIMEKFELTDWLKNEKLDLKSNKQILEKLHHLLHYHLNNEEIFSRYIRDKTEKQRIKKILSMISPKHR